MLHPNLIPAKKEIVEKKETTKERRARLTGKEIWLNSKTRVDVSDPTRAANWILDGGSGDGKSIALAIIGDQHKNSIIFDTIGGFENSLKWLGVKEEWETLSLGYGLRKKETQLKINVSSLCSSKITNILRNEFLTQRGKKYRSKFRKFFAMTPINPDKNYNSFKKLCSEGGFDFLLDELDVLLDPNDEGMRVSELIKNKKVVNCEGYEMDNRSMGILINSIFYHKTRGAGEKRKVHLKEEVLNKILGERLLIGIDDVQEISSDVSRTVGSVFSLGRKYAISGATSGTNVGDLHKKIKANANIRLIFSASFDEHALRDKLGLYDIDFYRMGQVKQESSEDRGWAYFSIRDDPRWGKSRLIHLEPDYLREEKAKEAEPEINLASLYGKLALERGREPS